MPYGIYAPQDMSLDRFPNQIGAIVPYIGYGGIGIQKLAPVSRGKSC